MVGTGTPWQVVLSGREDEIVDLISKTTDVVDHGYLSE